MRISKCFVSCPKYCIGLCRAAGFVSVLAFGHNVARSMLNILITFFMHEPIKYPIAKAARYVNILEAVSMSLVIVVAYISNVLFSPDKIITCSVFPTILGLLLFNFNLNLWRNHESLYIIGILLLAVGEAGLRRLLNQFLMDQLRSHELNTNTDEARVEEEEEARVDHRKKALSCGQRVWLIVLWICSAVVTYVISNYSWKIKFISSTSLLAGTYILFLFGIYFSQSEKFVVADNSLFSFFLVLKASLLKCHLNYPSSPDLFFQNDGNQTHISPQVKFLRWLDKAAIIESSNLQPEEQKQAGRLCTVTQVEELKLFLKMIPMWTTFFVVGLVGATGDTFSSEQGNNSDSKKFTFYLVIFLKPISRAIYSLYIMWFTSKRVSKAQLKLRRIMRIWFGMVLCIIFCAVARSVESHRLQIVDRKRKNPNDKIQNMSIFWLAPQYCLLGLMEGSCTIGLDEFMTDELPKSLKNYASEMNGFVIDGIGSFLSILYVHANEKLFSNTMNDSRLDKYYFRLLILSFLNMCYYYPISTIYRPIHYY